MPPRLELLTKHWSHFDLPILPFLAPRVLKPWPFNQQRVHSRTFTTHDSDERHRKGQDETTKSTRKAGDIWRPAIRNPILEAKRFAGSGRDPSDNNYGKIERVTIQSHGLKADPMAAARSIGMDLQLEEREERKKGENTFRAASRHIYGKAEINIPESTTRKLRIQRRKGFPQKVPGKYRVDRDLYGKSSLNTVLEYTWATDAAELVPNMNVPGFIPRIALQRVLAKINSLINPREKTIPDLIYKIILHKSQIYRRHHWESLHERTRRKVWLHLVKVALRYRPEYVPKILAATYTKAYVPPSVVSDIVDYVLMLLLRFKAASKEKLTRTITNEILDLLYALPKNSLELTQLGIYTLVSSLDGMTLGSFYVSLKERDHPMCEDTLIHFASRLAKLGQTDISFEILHILKSKHCDFNTPKMLSFCSVLLQSENRGTNATYSESEILKFMLESGMEANIITYNVMLQNALHSGEPESAWQIHDTMQDSGIEPDYCTYSLLLNDAKWRMDLAALKRVMEFVRHYRLRNAFIATDILHSILLLSQHNRSISNASSLWQLENGWTYFDQMLKVYSDYFHLHPLTLIVPDLSVVCPGHKNLNASRQDSDLFSPTAPTLVVMITGLLGCLDDPKKIRQLYTHFRNLIHTGNSAVERLADTTHIWNLFIMAFGRFRGGQADCLNIMRDMLSSHNNTATKNSAQEYTELANRGVLVPPLPDVYTWSILVKVFMDQGQPLAAEKVIVMMRERGVEPNLVTWNTLVSGYAKMQNVTMAVNAYYRIEESGFKIDERTIQNLYRIHNGRALEEALRSGNSQSLRTGTSFLNQLQNHTG